MLPEEQRKQTQPTLSARPSPFHMKDVLLQTWHNSEAGKHSFLTGKQYQYQRLYRRGETRKEMSMK